MAPVRGMAQNSGNTGNINFRILQWGFPKMKVPNTGGFTMEHPIEMDDDKRLPPFQETSEYLENKTLVDPWVPKGLFPEISGWCDPGRSGLHHSWLCQHGVRQRGVHRSLRWPRVPGAGNPHGEA